jgi:hypothetical protein
MTLADIFRKLEGTNLTDRSEDLLTSNIFGCLRYIPPDRVLVPFLETANSLSGSPLSIPKPVKKVYSSFWPSLSVKGYAACEPDVALGLETITNQLHLVLIEAKYLSGPSSDIDKNELPHHQLARELDQLSIISCADLNWETYSKPTRRLLLYVTKDNAMPLEDMKKGYEEYHYKRKVQGDIYWTSWCKLPSILEGSIQRETVPEYRIVMEDMFQLLEKKWLIYFRGVDSIKEFISVPDFYFNNRKWYEWPEIRIAPIYNYLPTSSQYLWPIFNTNLHFYQYKVR